MKFKAKQKTNKSVCERERGKGTEVSLEMSTTMQAKSGNVPTHKTEFKKYN